MTGIKRIYITEQMSGRGAWRFEESKAMHPEANRLYRDTFLNLNTPLAEGEENVECGLDEFMAGYDHALGIDVFLTYVHGQTSTLQEKFLFTTFYTVTVEYMQDWRNNIQGDWFNMRCQYYFVGYVNMECLSCGETFDDVLKYHKHIVGYKHERNGTFAEWVLLNWPSVQMATAQDRILWRERPNQMDGARANFRYVPFSELPTDVIVAKHGFDVVHFPD